MKRLTITVLLLGASGCGADPLIDEASETMTMKSVPVAEITDAELRALASHRIFFGHQSVGRDIMAGLRRVLEENPQISLRIVTAQSPGQVEGPALMESDIGENGDPDTKADAFAAVLEHGFGAEPGAIAGYKYCYLDMLPTTDPDQLFRDYAARMEKVRTRYPDLTLVHFTMPLTSGAGLKDKVKRFLGRPSQAALNAKRNRYNDLLRAQYGDIDPIFDLALLESTRRDGSRAYTRYRGENVFMLAAEWTEDGGHLNEAGQQWVAESLLVFFARALNSGAG